MKYTTIQELRIFFNDENLYHQIPKSIRVALEEGLQNYFSTICCSNFTGGAKGSEIELFWGRFNRNESLNFWYGDIARLYPT